MLRPSLASLTGLLIVAAAAAPGPAQASVLTAQVDDPRDSSGTPAQDVSGITVTYDRGAGTWTQTVRFHGPLTTDDRAVLYTSLDACWAGPPSPPPPVWTPALMQTWTDPADSAVGAQVSGLVDGVPTSRWVSEATTKQVSGDRRELTFSVTDPVLVDRDVCGVGSARLSAFGTVFDRVPAIELKPGSDGTDGGPPLPPSPERDAVAPTGQIGGALVLSRAGRARLVISHISEPALGTVVVRRPTGRVLARASFRAAAADATVSVPLRFARAVRRRVARRGALRVRVRITLADAGANTATIERAAVLRRPRAAGQR